MPEEIWKPIPSTSGHYEASSLGRIRRSAPGMNTKVGRVRALNRVGRTGYPIISLSIDGKIRQALVHRLVAEAFHGICPTGKEVNHKDGNRLNAQPDNLEYLTKSQNQQHAATVLGSRCGERSGVSKLTEVGVLEIRARHARGERLKMIADDFGITYNNALFIVKRQTWRHI